MGSKRFLLALDQGTSSSRALLFRLDGSIERSANIELRAMYPAPGWVEQDAEEIWSTQWQALEQVLDGIPRSDLAAVGITNQRETVLGWDRKSGAPLTRAIVWQCRRSAAICERLRQAGHELTFRDRTGLLLDPYFSGTKIAWLLEQTPGLRERTESGEVVFGTVDSWLLYRLTGELGTDVTNASRTLGMSLADCTWDTELLSLLDIPPLALCPIRSSCAQHGVSSLLGGAPITAILGDQQASLLGHGCVRKGLSKCTFGTGAFLLAHAGTESAATPPSQGVLRTVAWSGVPQSGPTNFALEGSIFIAGALIQWLRDKLGVIGSAAESERVARQVPDSAGVIIVPSFVGLGAPYWDADARGAIFGLTRDASAVHIVRASLEAVAHQVADLLELEDFQTVDEIRIDGGMSRNGLFCEILSEYTGRAVLPASSAELTARGAALLAGVGCGIWSSLEEADETFRPPSAAVPKKLTPQLPPIDRESARTRWRDAIDRTRSRVPQSDSHLSGMM